MSRFKKRRLSKNNRTMMKIDNIIETSTDGTTAFKPSKSISRSPETIYTDEGYERPKKKGNGCVWLLVLLVVLMVVAFAVVAVKILTPV